MSSKILTVIQSRTGKNLVVMRENGKPHSYLFTIDRLRKWKQLGLFNHMYYTDRSGVTSHAMKGARARWDK